MARAAAWEAAGITAILLVSAFLNLFQLDRLGLGNALYAAAIRSMGASGHAFWFAGFDAGGFLAVDKPPVGLWTQVLFTKALGYTGVAVLLPQALAGIGAVAVLYRLVRRGHGV